MDFEDLTIILTPHNRPLHLKRVLEYYRSWNVNIVIMDSSSSKFDYQNAISQRMSYYFQPNELYSNKLKFGLGKVNTNYVMIQAEDDFYTQSGLRASIHFLNFNPEYASCQGMFSAFTLNPISKKTVYYQSFNRDINAENINERINDIMGSYFQLFYAVHRKESLKATFDFASNRIKNLFVIEILIGFFAIIQGKHKVLNIFYGAREIIPSSAGRNNKNFNYFVSNSKTKKEYQLILEDIALIISKKDITSKNELLLQLKDATKLYLQGTKRKLDLLERINRRLQKFKIDAIIKKESPSYKKDWAIINEYINKYPVS
jgi:glycosyltransferase domain-containing protein